MWRLKLDNLILFGYFVAFVGSFWTGHAISALIWLLLALYHVLTDRLDRIEKGMHTLVKYHIARAHADGYGRDEAALEADNADHA